MVREPPTRLAPGQAVIVRNQGCNGLGSESEESPDVLHQMRRYWRCIHPLPATWLFYGDTPEEPMTADALRSAFNAALARAGR